GATAFQTELPDRRRQMAWHASVRGAGAAMPGWQHAIDVAHADQRVAGAAPYVELQGLLNGARNQPAMVRGILPDAEATVSVLGERVVQGDIASLQPGEFNIVLGKELALWLGVSLGDDVILYVPEYRSTPLGAVPQLKRFTVSGLFEAGHQEFDRGMAVVHMADAQRLLRMGEGVTGVRLRLHDMDRAWEVARELALQLGGPYMVSDWQQENANMFRALRLEKTMMAILLSLIIAMGAFNLVSSQVMLVTDKQADIAILRTLGLTPRAVMQVFMVQGTLIGVVGTVCGVVGGILLT